VGEVTLGIFFPLGRHIGSGFDQAIFDSAGFVVRNAEKDHGFAGRDVPEPNPALDHIGK
jgi:hypothetical protein